MPIVTHTQDGGFKAHGVPWDELKKVESYPQSLGSGWYSLPTRWAALALYRYGDAAVQDDLFLEHLEVDLSRALEMPGARQFRHPPEEELYPYQKAGVQYTLGRPHTLIGDPPGLGKQAALDTKILTPHGWTTMGEIRVGDQVIGSDGHPTAVTGVFPQGVKPSYRVTLQEGASTRCGPEHLWAVKTANNLKHGTGWMVKTAQQLMDMGTQWADGENKWFIPSVEVQGDDVDLPIDPYVLGVGRALEAMGLRVKSGERSIPETYQHASFAQRLALLRGLMDADGSCLKNRSTYHTKSAQLAEDVASLVRSLGGAAKVRWYNRENEGKGHEAQVTVRLNHCPFWGQRKAGAWEPPTGSHRVSKYIQSIEYVGEEAQQCISVAAPDGLYVTDDYIVTHNTSQSIVSANESGAQKVLVVCPASVRLQWADQIKRWVWPRNARTPTGLPMINLLLKGSDGVYQGKLPSWTIISYDLIARSKAIQEAVIRRGFDFVILDEIHYLKSFDARRTQAIFGHPDPKINDVPVVSGASRILGLTGTPLPNRPRECYAVARTFNWDVIDRMGEKAFMGKYNPKVPTGGKFTTHDTARPWELQARLRASIMVRRDKRAVLPQLPAVSWDILRLEPNTAVKAVLRAEAQTGIDPLDFDTSNFQAQGAIATVRREMGEAKVPLVLDHVVMMLDGGEPKVVIFTWHRDVLTMLAEELDAFGVTTLKGGMTAKGAHEAKERFVQNPNVRVFIGQIQACGVGINGLQEVCQTAVFAEASWTPGDNEQAVDRLARIGQTGAVSAQFLVAPGGMDDKVLSASVGKAHDTHNVLDARAG